MSDQIYSEALGIHQSDIIIRTALIAAIKDLRANPRLLDRVWGTLSESELDRAKTWFLKTDIPVVMVPRLDEAKVPCITIALAESSEAEVTLGDIHYVSYEQNDSDWPPLITSFLVEGYNPETNTITLPQAVLDVLVVAPGMFIVDARGRSAEILTVNDAVVTIEPTPELDLSATTIKGKTPPFNVTLESVNSQETYQIGVHVSGEPAYLSWMHALLSWALLRYKQDYLEARGFERSVFSSSAFDRNEHFVAELVWSRYFSITGYVRQYWPKHFLTRPNSTEVDVQVEPSVAASTAISSESEPAGIFQPDLKLRAGLIQALQDLRANPWLLDYAFLSMQTDSLTAGQYAAEVESAKSWFLKTNIPVLITPVLDKPKLPCVTIKLQGSSEAETTLGDVHYVSTELDPDAPWEPLCAPFTPIGFNPTTGVMKLSLTDLARVPISPGFYVIDANGGQHQILEVYDDDSFKVAGSGDFRGAVVKGEPPSKVRHLESMTTKEDLQVGLHVSGEPVYLHWLHSIIVFCLLRYKETYLEAQGLERTAFDSTDFDRNMDFEAELVFSRYVNLRGFVRQYWEKDYRERINTTTGAIRVIGGDRLPSDTPPDTALWIGEYDTLSPRK